MNGCHVIYAVSLEMGIRNGHYWSEELEGRKERDLLAFKDERIMNNASIFYSIPNSISQPIVTVASITAAVFGPGFDMGEFTSCVFKIRLSLLKPISSIEIASLIFGKH